MIEFHRLINRKLLQKRSIKATITVITIIGSFIIVNQFLSNINNPNPTEINISGRQRMLCQIMMKEALLINFNHTSDISILQEARIQFELSHYFLRFGNSTEGISAEYNDKIIKKWDEINTSYYENFKPWVERIENGEKLNDSEIDIFITEGSNLTTIIEEYVLLHEKEHVETDEELQKLSIVISVILTILWIYLIIILLNSRTLKSQKKIIASYSNEMRHDLRNYLKKIELQIDLYDSEIKIDVKEKIIEYLDDVNDILSYSYLLANKGLIIGELEKIDPNIIIDKLIGVIVPKHIIVEKSYLSQIKADKVKFNQMLKNILENAIIHGNPTKICIYEIKRKNCIKLYIGNNGTPIAPETIDFILENKATNNKKHIGSAIINQIIQAHGWVLTIVSNEKETLFEIKIPLNSNK